MKKKSSTTTSHQMPIIPITKTMYISNLTKLIQESVQFLNRLYNIAWFGAVYA